MFLRANCLHTRADYGRGNAAGIYQKLAKPAVVYFRFQTIYRINNTFLFR